MMFLRHGMFARKAKVERRRKLVVGAVLGLLLVMTAAIYAAVKAAGSMNLAYTDASNKGLTSGNISGTLTRTDNSEAINLDRDGKVKLNLQFNFTNDVVESAKDADSWVYDLSSVTNNSFISSVEDITSPVDIVNDGVVIAKYTVSNGVVTVVPEKTQDAADWWTTHTTNVKVGLSLNLILDKVGVGVDDSDSFVLPGTTTDIAPAGHSTNEMYYDNRHVAIHEAVFNEASQDFAGGNYDKLISVEKDGSDYIATYNTDFYMDFYAPDMQVTIALDGDQTFVSGGSFEMTSCTTYNCIHDPSKTTISVPSTYVTLSADNKTATIDMEGFLYDYCEGSGSSACAAAGINGYILNNPMNRNNANGSDFYIEYKANLGQSNPAGNGKSYSATATISSTNGSISATDTVKYSTGLPGSKTGTCANGSTTVDYVTTCNDDGAGNVYIDYVVKVGDPTTDLSKIAITDRITDNQILDGDITLTSPSGATTTILKTNVCANDTDNDCIVAAAIDTDYFLNSQKLFSHAFSSGDVGEWTVSYRVKVASDAVISGNNVDNIIDLTIDQNTYFNVWATSTYYEFERPYYIEKELIHTDAANGAAQWKVVVYGPASGSKSNVVVTDTLYYDASYTTGSISKSVYAATKTVGGTTVATSDYSTSIVDNNLKITIPTLNAGEIYTFNITTNADADFIAAYQGQTVQITNQACRDDDGCSEQIRTNILTPNAETMTKDGVEAGNVFFWNLDAPNNKYVYGVRRGYVWTATINPSAGAVQGTGRQDYEPWFSDTIPAGMYLTHRYNQNSMPDPTCVTAGACDASIDIDQSKYSTVIEVKRSIPSIPGEHEETISNVPVTVTNGVIEPINLAALFNENCTIPIDGNPTMDCAGLDGIIYTVTYATTLSDAIYNDYANEHSFTNQAKLYEKVGDQNTQRAYAADTVTYVNDSAIEKSDSTAMSLDSTNKITYAITVNKAGYAYKNGGVPYGPDDTRPMLTITDHISEDVNILTTGFSAQSTSVNSAKPIVCTDINDVIVNDCSFSYQSETRVLTAQVPDGLVRKIWYNVVVANPVPNRTSEYVNTAVLHTDNLDFESTARANHTVNGESGYIIANGTMNIKKVNADNLSEVVSGAKFKLVQVAYDASTGALGNETVIDLNGASEGTDGQTDNNGVIKFTNLCGYSTETPDPASNCSNGGQLYYWQEVSAPAPYLPTDGTTKHYFVLYDEANLATDTDANKAVARYVANIVEENGNNNVVVEVLKSNYEWIVTNNKQIETSIAIDKKITGNTASVDKTFSITIHATDLADNPLNGTYEYDTYFVSDPNGTLQQGGNLAFTNGDATITLDHNRGVVIYGVYVGGNYTVTESNNTGYTVSYVCSDLSAEAGCTSATSNTGVFVADAGAAAAIDAGGNPDFEDIGQRVSLTNDSSTEITGISTKKPSLAIAVVFGGTMAALGIIIARRFRH